MIFALKNDDFCIKNDELRSKGASSGKKTKALAELVDIYQVRFSIDFRPIFE